MDRILTGYRVSELHDRQHVHGTITYYQPGVALVLQDGSKKHLDRYQTLGAAARGRRSRRNWISEVKNGFLTLTRGEIRRRDACACLALAVYLATTGGGRQRWTWSCLRPCLNRGPVVTEVREATQDEYVLQSDGHLLSAIIRHPGTVGQIPLPRMREIPLGARIRVTGICMLTNANPFNGEVPFNVLMRDANDIVVVARLHGECAAI